ncbi:RNA polymerase sigma factor [Flavobacteriaceae bacterium SZ-1-7]|uniref:RNA polymerase sigma factor n=1 Tax=Tamlana sedimenti TaxID=3134126 RepID=UPI003122C5F8
MPKDIREHICEEKIFSGIYNKYAKNLHDFLYYKFGSHLDPNDKMQEAFIKLWENCKNVKPSSARSFLFKVANNLMLNDIKHQKVVMRYKEEKPKEYTNESPEFILEEKQFLKKYQKALGTLPEEQRITFLMSKADKKSHTEIAEILGVTRRVVDSRVYNASLKLKAELEEFNNFYAKKSSKLL